MTRRGRGGTTALLVVALLASWGIAPGTFGAAPAAAQDYWESEYERNQQELSSARSALDLVGDSIAAATTDLRSIDEQLSAMYDELALREADLATAKTDLQLAQARTRAADDLVAAATARLLDAQAQRAETEQRFEGRIVALWKYGMSGYADAILQADSISEVLVQADYVDRVLDNDRTLIDDIRAAEERITRERASVDRARDTKVLEEAGVKAAVDQVQRLTDIQQNLVEQVEVEQRRRKRILDGLRADEERYQQTVRNLEAESDRIKQELLRSRYAAGRPGKGEFVWPTSGPPGSGYGWRTHPISGERRMHAGIDIGAPTGQKIVAATDGLVVSAGWRGGYGLCVVIDHGGGVATLYAHQSRLAVSKGEIVASGETIGYVGSTGYSTGPHLHFEVRVDGSPVDPMDWY